MNKVALIRRRLHISQSQLASLLSVSVKTVQAWEGNRYAPNGGNAKLLQLLGANQEMKAMLEKYKNDQEFAPLERDPEKLTIMGVHFKNEQDYRAVLNAVANNMYEGYQPARADIEFFAAHIDQPATAQETLAWVKAHRGTADE
ncbi:helix-turn-helix domain-containing protein [Schleiferilactobacillus perolens]|uniref:helix-turn-helix domain-containing protein n=1 Tax=Schleiferilactobacillus perolens TaxID=100468 RepID=UPI002356E606|nr:helix-turn-helix domain-containing protein [Schleiferilactobacillus perolens]MCI2170379.1 transcription regulator, Xre family protein [Schleiferilactobacillus perolens]